MDWLEFKRERFCEDIRVGRAKHRLSQQDVGDKFGVSRVTISNWENGHYEFTAERFLALCFYFSLEPLNYMLTPSQKAVSSEDQKVDDRLSMDMTFDEITGHPDYVRSDDHEIDPHEMSEMWAEMANHNPDDEWEI